MASSSRVRFAGQLPQAQPPQPILKFTLNSGTLKVFKSCLLHLGKIDAELKLEALPSELSLRAINSSQSAIMTIRINRCFFDTYEVVDYMFIPLTPFRIRY